MPEETKDNAPSKEESPAPVEKAGSAPGGLKAWLPLVITVLLMPALAFVMTRYMLLPRLQQGLGITAHATAAPEGEAKHGEPKKKTKESKDAKRTSVNMNKLLVNVAGTMGARYLLVSLSISSPDPNLAKAVEEHEAQLKDMAMGALRVKTLADLEKPSAANLIRTELISGFNNILGDGTVQDIYLTEFAVQ
jgi:flagellar protein FliL